MVPVIRGQNSGLFLGFGKFTMGGESNLEMHF